MTPQPESTQQPDPVQVLAEKAKHQEIVRQLIQEELTKNLSDPTQLVVHKIDMGITESFLGSVTLEWLAHRVQFAHNLPIFSSRLSEDRKRIENDPAAIKDLRQRPIDYRREFPMAQYILRRDNHKFAPLLLVLHDDWVDTPTHENWTGGVAVKSAANFESLDEFGTFGRLHMAPSHTLYALDGQHRLAAIKAVVDFVQGDPLVEKDKKGRDKKSQLTKEDLQKDDPNLTESAFQHLIKERVGVEIITSIKRGETYTQSQSRVRSIFVHVNRLAQTVEKGQNAALDEDNGFALVAQDSLEHPVLSCAGEDGERSSLVEFESPNIKGASHSITTMFTLFRCAAEFLSQGADPYDRWTPKIKSLVAERPPADELSLGLREFTQFLDLLAAMPVFAQTRSGVDARALREFGKAGDGTRHLLLRPAAQIMLAKAVGHCKFHLGWEMTTIEERLVRMDHDGVFSECDARSSIWWGLQISPEKGRIKNSTQPVVANMLIYLLGGMKDPEDLELLTVACASKRTLLDTTYGWDGKALGRTELRLPGPRV